MCETATRETPSRSASSCCVHPKPDRRLAIFRPSEREISSVIVPTHVADGSAPSRHDRPMASKRALITGITGQDGSYLAELLLQQGYEVIGMVRRLSSENHHRLEAFRDRITIHTGDLLDQRSLRDVMRACEPEGIYNLAAMSFVGA